LSYLIFVKHTGGRHNPAHEGPPGLGDLGEVVIYTFGAVVRGCTRGGSGDTGEGRGEKGRWAGYREDM
jgi:hypothetical protein